MLHAFSGNLEWCIALLARALKNKNIHLFIKSVLHYEKSIKLPLLLLTYSE